MKQNGTEKRIALFPGTFDPFTIGHESLVRRGLALMDEIIIAIGTNEAKKSYFTLEKRIGMLRDFYREEPRVRVESYDSLTISFAQEVGARYILRGIRSVTDFEYEDNCRHKPNHFGNRDVCIIYYAAPDAHQLHPCEGIVTLRARCQLLYSPGNEDIIPNKKTMQKRIIAMAVGVLLVSGGALAQFRPSPEGLKIERTLQLINSLYVDDVDSKELTEAAIRAMLEELDPHSSYLNEEEVRAMNEPLQGNFDGIGISFNMLTDTLYVMEVISGGPSEGGYYGR